MIPQLTLDDEEFNGIVEKAVKQIPGLYAEWTDYNAHDPGITMIELLAWFKEMQQFHLDQMGEAYTRKYLKLMGIKPRSVIPAQAELFVDGLKKHTVFPKGSRFYAEEICFETTEEVSLDGVRVVKLVSEGTKGQEIMVGKKQIRFLPFGAKPQAGDIFRIGLSGPLTPGILHRLSFHFFSDAPVKRNPIEGRDFIPLATYQLLYRKDGRYQEANIRGDTTHQMLEDGALAFFVEEEMEPGEDGLYWLYLKLEQCDYDLPPVIAGICFSCFAVSQRCTCVEFHDLCLKRGESFLFTSYLAVCGACGIFLRKGESFQRYEGCIQREMEENGCRFSLPDLPKEDINCRVILYEAEYQNEIWLAEGTGMPYQEYLVEIPNLCAGGLALMAETGEGTGCYEVWEQCEDFDASSPFDRHFHFEEETGILSFGDCEHGMAPEGNILLCAAHTSLGAKGNVKAGSICRFEGAPKGVRVQNDREAAGGENREDFEQCRERMLLQLKEHSRAVTYEDFVSLAKGTPGLMIENVKAIPVTELRRWDGYLEEETVSLVVKPYSRENKPALSEAYRKNIEFTLEPRRIAGTKIRVLSPEYVGVSVFAEISITIHSAAAREQIREVLEQFFSEIRADFGAVISYSAVYGRIDVLESVAAIKSFGMDAQGRDIRRSRSGDIFLPVNGLAWMRECHLILRSDG